MAPGELGVIRREGTKTSLFPEAHSPNALPNETAIDGNDGMPLLTGYYHRTPRLQPPARFFTGPCVCKLYNLGTAIILRAA